MNQNSKAEKFSHILVIESYEGCSNFLTNQPEEWELSRGLGLPLEEIAEALDCRITVLCWDEWYGYEAKETWTPFPATRPLYSQDCIVPGADFIFKRVQRISIPPRDPEHRLPFSKKGLSPRSYGLINDSGLLFFISCCLHEELKNFYTADPFQMVILPMLGGIGYVVQMSKATMLQDAIRVPFAVVVTDTSANQQQANHEGLWTRHATITRQMEDISLALADLAITFGPRGKQIAHSGRLPEALPPKLAPRFVKKQILDKIAEASSTLLDNSKPFKFFLYEPQQACSGILAMLDAVNLAFGKGLRLPYPFVSAGPPMVFAPVRPRAFEDYWSSRGFAKELIRHRQWEWHQKYPDLSGNFPIRFYPSLFDHLPVVWPELARQSLCILSPASAEGIAPGQDLPKEILLPGEPEPAMMADHLLRLAATNAATMNRIRKELCSGVVSAHRGNIRKRLLEETVKGLKQILFSPPPPADLSRIALMFLDRRVPLSILAGKNTPPIISGNHSGLRKGKLSVVITCYEMGKMIQETMESVWNSTRSPEEILLIDDGSHGNETLETINSLEITAKQKSLPLKVIRQKNQGLAAARNVGLDSAKGEFISFIDGDDLIEPGFYHTAVQILQKYPRLGGVASWAFIFGENCAPGFWNAPQAELPLLFSENSVVVPCMMRTSILRELGGYDVRQRYNYEDWELSIRLVASGWPIITVPAHLMHYRIRSGSLYRDMTSIQNQVMRELMLHSHQETVSRFSMEIVMQMENRLMECLYPPLDPRHKVKEPVSRHNLFSKLSGSAHRSLRRVIKILKG